MGAISETSLEHMGDLWISDEHGRVLGPVSLQVVQDLINAGRLPGIRRVSLDGKAWQDAATSPDLAALLGSKTAPAHDRVAQERAQAEGLRTRLKEYQAQPPHRILQVPENAPLEAYRASFFALAKRYHPGRAPPGTHPELVQAARELFEFLGKLMQSVERERAPKPQAPPASSSPRSAPPGPTPTPPQGSPSYRLEDFVGWSNGAERALATVRITQANAGLFTDHGLANLAMGGVFVPSAGAVPLGTLVELTFVFEGSPRTVRASGRVIWENSGAVKKAVSGVGVRLTDLKAEDKAFIQSYLDGLPPKGRPVLRF